MLIEYLLHIKGRKRENNCQLYLQSRNRDTDIENKGMGPMGEKRELV